MRIGLTGGIGSGKSVVASIFEYLGAAVYDSDSRAKALMTESRQLRDEIIGAFGAESYLPNGDLNREFLRSVVFVDVAGRVKMNSIVHPAVAQDFARWADVQTADILLFESALLLQTASRGQMHRVLAVTAPESVRVNRVMQRDGIDREAALLRLSSQMSQSEICSLACDIIDNSGNVLIIPQVVTLFNIYKNGKI